MITSKPLFAVFCSLFAFGIGTLTAQTEIATGMMLGSQYEARLFYTRQTGGAWRKTYSGTRYRSQAAGRLMNLRIAQALYDDEWLTEVPFDPEKNTQRLIQALDTYKDHGIMAISVSLQGGYAAYERTGNIHRGRDAKLGPGKGTLTSAFRADGSLKHEWMRRTLRVVKELDRRGMILDLIYFYQGQDEVLTNSAAINRAVRNTTDWLIDHDCRNVIIEIANEFNVKAYDHNGYIFEHINDLVELARQCFAAKHAAFRLPVSFSSAGRNQVGFGNSRQAADFTIIHGNGLSPEDKRVLVNNLMRQPQAPGPVYMNEDDNGRETTAEHLARELQSCDAVFNSGASWGYMPWVQVQNFPFRYHMPSATARVDDNMPQSERDRAYFHAVLDHVRQLVSSRNAGHSACRLSLTR
jgi:hypothetical protein